MKTPFCTPRYKWMSCWIPNAGAFFFCFGIPKTELHAVSFGPSKVARRIEAPLETLSSAQRRSAKSWRVAGVQQMSRNLTAPLFSLLLVCCTVVFRSMETARRIPLPPGAPYRARRPSSAVNSEVTSEELTGSEEGSSTRRRGWSGFSCDGHPKYGVL